MPQLIPLKAIPAQDFQIVLNNQSCLLSIKQLDYGLFMSVSLSDQLIVGDCICLNLTKIVRNSIAAIGDPGFLGDFAFYDTQGETDPVYTGLGSRYQLYYYTPEELA